MLRLLSEMNCALDDNIDTYCLVFTSRLIVRLTEINFFNREINRD